ncbi:ABC transporter ATP-binding protein [Gelidibacter maritimus]|uniref:ABC transporter ATP-binding protein n=1 Tax=Gelidibacter maritimus TaxID=2761487 RepID=A0A7W2R3J8_9FLAO|nr:ABC transporter ATP-binding protein [Gelidibacter maritimus]MBA6152698.1 ABC transporter ATP-binding protein [Gelidibacter maritimus]
MIILKAENISKQYRLGLVGTGTISHDLNRWWAGIRGKEDPYLKVGSINDRSTKADSDYVWALRDINFEVQQGEVLGIIGKNGAGKSTLLKILSRVTIPTTGEIKTKGRIASLLEVGTGFHPELTGRENIYLNGAILGMTKAEIKAKEAEIIEFSGCERYVYTPVKRYSSGMRVRLAFAVAAFLEPDILVIDEVLAVGDAEFQKKAIGKMQDISKGDGRTVLFVSHSMAAVKSLCTRAIVLEHGTSVFEGDTDEAVDFYLKKNDKKEYSDIGLRKDRSGSGEIIISKIELYSKSNLKIDSVISGEYLRMRVEFKIEQKVEGKLIFGFSINDTQEQMKAMVVTDEMGIDINTVLEKGFLDIEIERVLLRGGVYNFQFILSKNTTQKENHVDYIEKGFYLNVLPGDFYNVGHMNRKYNAIILPCKIR